MNEIFSKDNYDAAIEELFRRFPSFQKAGVSAYKPGIGNIMLFDSLLGHPHKKYASVHVAGTNGKGSVCNMLASLCASAGLRTGLYTSPHLYDFRERMRIADGRDWNRNSGNGTVKYIAEEEVWDFIQKWGETFDHLDLSFFEITTAMAFDWFAKMEVDIAIVETGLGGRLDSTNIISPLLSVITNIGLDHCDLLGSTLPEIAFEKAGIIKPRTAAVVGESNPQTDAVFERKVLYTNLPEAEYMGDRSRIMSLLTFADKVSPPLWDRHDEILKKMDLRGDCQKRNLRTVLTAYSVLADALPAIREHANDQEAVADAIIRTARRMDFHGRWEVISESPYIICDIGHNPHGLRDNFMQLERMINSGDFDRLTIVYGAMADKDVDGIMKMIPRMADCLFVTAPGKRALQAEDIYRKFLDAGGEKSRARCFNSVEDALSFAIGSQCDLPENDAGKEFEAKRHNTCGEAPRHLIYIGGSTYVVARTATLRLKLAQAAQTFEK